jgi:hypothetical protein
MALAGDERTPYCAYTIGRTEHGQPELLILARTLKELMPLTGLLCYLGLREMQDGRVIGPTDDDVFLVTDPSHWPDAPDYIHERLVVQADAYYGRRVDVLLLVQIENPEAFFGEEESPERPPAAVIH